MLENGTRNGNAQWHICEIFVNSGRWWLVGPWGVPVRGRNRKRVRGFMSVRNNVGCRIRDMRSRFSCRISNGYLWKEIYHFAEKWGSEFVVPTRARRIRWYFLWKLGLKLLKNEFENNVDRLIKKICNKKNSLFFQTKS